MTDYVVQRPNTGVVHRPAVGFGEDDYGDGGYGDSNTVVRPSTGIVTRPRLYQ